MIKKYGLIGLLGVIALIACSGVVFLYTRPAEPVVILSDIYAVLYSDNTAEIIVRDDMREGLRTNDGVNTAAYRKTYRTPILPMQITEQNYIFKQEETKTYLPRIAYLGSSQNSVVFTYPSPEDESCNNNIFYIDRSKAESRVIKTSYCIHGSLDNKEYSHWFGTKYDEDRNATEVAVGLFEAGEILAHAEVAGRTMYGTNTEPFFRTMISANWEKDRVVFLGPAKIHQPEYDGPPPQSGVCYGGVYSLSVADGSLQYIEPEYSCDKYQKLLVYEGNFFGAEHSGKFYLASFDYDDMMIYEDKILLDIAQ